MNEDVTTVSPTLGFIIKTIDFQGYDPFYLSDPNDFIQNANAAQIPPEHL